MIDLVHYRKPERKEESIIIFPCNILNEKALESRNKHFFLHFLALELSTSYIATYRYVHRPVVTQRLSF